MEYASSRLANGAAALAYWSSLAQARTLRTSIHEHRAHSSHSWYVVEELTALHAVFAEARRSQLEGLLSKTNAVFQPLTDPLMTDFGAHRWLAREREETYSDWFAWVLEKSPGSISRILGLSQDSLHERIQIEREIAVRYSNCDESGRLDLFLRSGTKQICIVEIKTQEYSQEDLVKQERYCKATGMSPDVQKVFVAIHDAGYDLCGFRFLSWADVCLRLRNLVPELIQSKEVVTAAMILAFVGAVEVNLLHLTASTGDTAYRVVKTVEHLERFIGGIL